MILELKNTHRLDNDSFFRCVVSKTSVKKLKCDELSFQDFICKRVKKGKKIKKLTLRTIDESIQAFPFYDDSLEKTIEPEPYAGECVYFYVERIASEGNLIMTKKRNTYLFALKSFPLQFTALKKLLDISLGLKTSTFLDLTITRIAACFGKKENFTTHCVQISERCLGNRRKNQIINLVEIKKLIKDNDKEEHKKLHGAVSAKLGEVSVFKQRSVIKDLVVDEFDSKRKYKVT